MLSYGSSRFCDPADGHDDLCTELYQLHRSRGLRHVRGWALKAPAGTTSCHATSPPLTGRARQPPAGLTVPKKTPGRAASGDALPSVLTTGDGRDTSEAHHACISNLT